MKERKCDYYYNVDYYETDCGNQLEEEDYESIQPTYCPFCGGKINIINN